MMIPRQTARKWEPPAPRVPEGAAVPVESWWTPPRPSPWPGRIASTAVPALLIGLAVLNVAAAAGDDRDPSPAPAGWELRDSTPYVDTRHMIERGGW